MLPQITTPQGYLTLLSTDQADLLVNFVQTNRQFLAPWEPKRLNSYYQLSECRQRIRLAEQSFHRGNGVPLTILNHTQDTMLGYIHCSNIVRGVFQAGYLGFALGQTYQGQGIMRTAFPLVIDYLFHHWGLHRLMANHLPHNTRSANLLNACGFEQEGYAKAYLKINGQWQDHVLTALVNPNNQPVNYQPATL